MKKVIIYMFLLVCCLFVVKKEGEQVSAYTNHCWNCSATIDSSYCERCEDCRWYICENCGACSGDCNSYKERKGGHEWIIWIITIGAIVLIGYNFVVHRR